MKRSTAPRATGRAAAARALAARPADGRTLLDLDGIGPAMLEDLRRLGVHHVAALARRDGDALYDQLCRLTGLRQDPCVLDTFRCAVAQARDPGLPPAQRQWWWWSRQRKAAAAPSPTAPPTPPRGAAAPRRPRPPPAAPVPPRAAARRPGRGGPA